MTAYNVKSMPGGGRSLPGLPEPSSYAAPVASRSIQPTLDGDGYPPHPLPVVGQWDCPEDEIQVSQIGACEVPDHAPFATVDFTYSYQISGGTIAVDDQRFFASVYCSGGTIPGFYIGLFIFDGDNLKIVDWALFTESKSIQRRIGFTRTIHDNVFLVNISGGQNYSAGQHSSLGTIVVSSDNFVYEEKLTSLSVFGHGSSNCKYTAYVAPAPEYHWFVCSMCYWTSSSNSTAGYMVFSFDVNNDGDLIVVSDYLSGSASGYVLQPCHIDFKGICTVMKFAYQVSNLSLGAGTIYPASLNSNGVPDSWHSTLNHNMDSYGMERSYTGQPGIATGTGVATSRVNFRRGMSIPMDSNSGCFSWYPKSDVISPGNVAEQSVCNYYVANALKEKYEISFDINQSYSNVHTVTNFADCGGEGVAFFSHHTTNQSRLVLFLPDWRGGKPIVRSVKIDNSGNISRRRVVFLGDSVLLLYASSATDNRVVKVQSL